MKTVRVNAYQSLRRMGYSRGEAAQHLHITYAQAWAWDQTTNRSA